MTIVLAPTALAGARPATPALAPGRQFCPPSHRKRRAAMHRQHANRRTHRQNDRTNRFNPNSLSQPRRPNPHSARSTAVTCSTAISCLGAFRTPAASVRDSLINAGVRKPASIGDIGAAFHSITSSASASNLDGTSRPSALAVVRFTTSSNFVGCSIGRFAATAPRSSLST